MEAVGRSPYQGVFNIVRFNWHFYAIAGMVMLALFAAGAFDNKVISWTCISLASGIALSTAVSLVVSHYVYDRSHLYDLHWLELIGTNPPQTIINIHAGFDETSHVLRKHFADATVNVFDFYDPHKHTEISIERARNAYPPFPGTIKITTDALPAFNASADIIFNIFALHEVRCRAERIDFLKLQAAALAADGRCVVVEHLRDIPNFLAYNIGFLHFFSPGEWKTNFLVAGFTIEKKFDVTPFVSVFILKKRDGNTP